MADELVRTFEKLDVRESPGDVTEVNCKQFQHLNPSKILPSPLSFFQEVEEAEVLTQLLPQNEFVLGSRHGLASLKPDMSKFIQDGSRCHVSNYFGHDLLTHYDQFIPLATDQLENMQGIQNFINQSGSVKKDEKLTIICSRHNLVELIMSPFSNQDVCLSAVYSNGVLHLFPDKLASRQATGIHSNDERMRKLCYTGFELENLVTTPAHSQEKTVFYSIVRGRIDSHLECLFKAEIDCVDPTTGIYTEIKCSAGIKPQNSYHRQKLLRMWVQTSLIPRTTLLVGIRDPYYNQLTSFERYTRGQLYRKFNNSNLKFIRQNYNCNANISVQWFHHIMKVIQSCVCQYVVAQGSDDSPLSFKISLSKDLLLRIRKLKNKPPGSIF
ncbi:LADA_0B03444g1_1 [Lachancea dasiensis]|uniref:Decapping nuclease n=1 Tax=Lachancea dasiensis TaxID=1072105 RepID=A0A1G4ISF8_9SACH|nr:LADA_0B03444g1_1 [Lachancea dasiensis]